MYCTIDLTFKGKPVTIEISGGIDDWQIVAGWRRDNSTELSLQTLGKIAQIKRNTIAHEVYITSLELSEHYSSTEEAYSTSEYLEELAYAIGE